MSVIADSNGQAADQPAASLPSYWPYDWLEFQYAAHAPVDALVLRKKIHFGPLRLCASTSFDLRQQSLGYKLSLKVAAIVYGFLGGGGCHLARARCTRGGGMRRAEPHAAPRPLAPDRQVHDLR